MGVGGRAHEPFGEREIFWNIVDRRSSAVLADPKEELDIERIKSEYVSSANKLESARSHNRSYNPMSVAPSSHRAQRPTSSMC